MFKFGLKGAWNDRIISKVNPNSDGGDVRVTATTQELTVEALKKSGFSEQEANSHLAMTASGYAANILLAQLREAKLLPDQDLDIDVLPMRTFIDSVMEMRTRLDLPQPEPMSEETHARLMGILTGEVRRTV